MKFAWNRPVCVINFYDRKHYGDTTLKKTSLVAYLRGGLEMVMFFSLFFLLYSYKVNIYSNVNFAIRN